MPNARMMKFFQSTAVFFTTRNTRTLLLFRSPVSSAASSSSWLSTPGNPLMRWPSSPDSCTAVVSLVLQAPPCPPPRTPPLTSSEEEHGELATACFTISQLLRFTTDPSDIDSALLRSGVSPSASLVAALLRSGGLPAVALLALSRWASSHLTPSILTSLVDLLAKSRAFASAWSLILDHSPAPLSAFAAIFRRYARVGMPSAAIRTFQYMGRHPESVLLEEQEDADPFELLIGALCKEGQTKPAAELVALRRKEAVSATAASCAPSIRVYNMLLHGWFRSRKLRKAERLWVQIRREGVRPTVVTYGTLIEGLCRMRRPDQAIDLLEEMRSTGIEANALTCNPIVDALAEDGRFKEALGMLEKFPLYGVSPNISTFNSLVKGFCKKGDLVGASQVLKKMIGRGICPTATTYNYFFSFFAKYGKIEEGINLYTKMIQSGYSPDRLTYQLLIKMLCEEKRLDLAVQLIKEMNRNGFGLDLATSTMLVHLLCRMHRFEEACMEYESMVKRGIVPQYITYRMLTKELNRLGIFELERKVSGLMNSVQHSTKLPNTYREREGDEIVQRRKSIMKKAQVMSDALKTCKDPKELSKLKSSSEKAVESANVLIANIRRRVYAVQRE